MDNKLVQKAEELLEMVAGELRKRGRSVVTHPADLKESGRAYHERWLLKVDGDVVPFHIDEPWEGDVWRRRPSGRLKASCEWVWNMDLPGGSVRMKSKTFGYSKARAATGGFEIGKIADHLELWHKVDKDAREEVARRKGFSKQWKVVADGLRARFPGQAKFITSDEKGLHISLTLGEKQAEDVLAALAGDSCRVCHAALLPREKPICEDCYRRGTDDGSDL